MSGRRVALLSVAAFVIAGCGGGQSGIGVAKPEGAMPVVNDEWPLVATAPAGAISVKACLESPDGAEVQVRAYLASVTTACPKCSTGAQQERSEASIGHTSRAEGPPPTGCPPCPAPAATLGDEVPRGPNISGVTLRAGGAATALQQRHVGRAFVLTGTFHANGPSGPELEVADVRAVALP